MPSTRPFPVPARKSPRPDPGIGDQETWTISRLAKAFSLSRSTLLYYDRIGLLSASSRTTAGYRLYDSGTAERLRRICALRETGVPLEDIHAILENPEDGILAILGRRLEGIGAEMSRLRIQQRAVTALLAPRDGTPVHSILCDRNLLQENLRRAGVDDRQMRTFHSVFETSSPQAHADFLQFLGFSAEEASTLRSKVRNPTPS
jgi:MerR family transcriptional regulator, thiopeptide resistance regulator